MKKGELYWVLELNVNKGKEKAFQELRQEMIQHTKNEEEGCLGYEWFISDGKHTCHIMERYANEEAVLTHLQNFGEHYAERFMDCLTPMNVTVYGSPSDKVKKGLKSLNPRYMVFEDGFKR